jgi:hypothetical protein
MTDANNQLTSVFSCSGTLHVPNRGRFVRECLAFSVFAAILAQADRLDARRMILQTRRA